MLTFDPATAMTAFFAICLFFCIVSYSNDYDDRGRGRPHRTSSARYGSRTTKPAHRPHTSPLTVRTHRIYRVPANLAPTCQGDHHCRGPTGTGETQEARDGEGA